MAGRGRGRGGVTMSINAEALGIGRGDIPATVLEPPPLFPQLVNRPVQIQQGLREKRMLQLQSNIFNNFRASQQQVYQNIDWSYMPKELKVGLKKRKKEFKPNLVKSKGDVNIEDKLKSLEEKEKFDGSGDEEETEKKPSDSDDEDKKEDEEEIEDEDEEMDDGTDYANNYFDNGEGDDDDDGGDDEQTF